MKRVLCLLLLAAACAPPAESPPPPDTPESGLAVTTPNALPAECIAADHLDFIGKRIEAVAPPTNSRIIRPGVPVTDDRRSDRLNIVVDENGLITSVECY